MKFYSLGKNATCSVLKLNGVTVMLDCGLEFDSLLSFLPSTYLERLKEENQSQNDSFYKFKNEPNNPLHKIGKNGIYLESKEMKLKLPNFDLIDLANVDAIIISNYMHIFALPFLTENTTFNGMVFATEPTLQIGRQLMEEFCILYYQQQQKLSNLTDVHPSQWMSSLSHLPTDYQVQFEEIWKWCSLYDHQTLLRSISKIQPVSYNEKKSIYSLLTVTAYSSGYCLGSANWVLETSLEKIVYISESSTVCERHPESLQVHSLGSIKASPAEIANMKGKYQINSTPADVLILSNKAINHFQSPHLTSESLMQDAIAHIGMTINEGNNVLIPAWPSGIIFDLFENIETLLIGSGGSSGRMKKVPIFFVSPVAELCLAYANIIPEWLYKTKQDKAYVPEAPFLHEDMVANKHLYYFNDAHSLINSTVYSEPCIVFVGHPSLRCGEVLSFLEMWGNSPNTLLYLDNDFNFERAFAPFKYPKLNIVSCPIDWRLNQSEAKRLIQEISPSHLLLPSQPNFGQLEIPVTYYNALDIISIPLTRKFQKALISSDLAMQLKPKVQGDLLITDVNAILSCRNHRYFIDEAPLADANTLRLHHQHHTCGSPTANQLVLSLRKRGIEPSRVVQNPGFILIEFGTLNSSIYLSPGESKIMTESDSLRLLFTESILEQCSNI